MSSLKKALRCSLLLAFVMGLLACGVRGDPLPPEKPVELGRGRPTYRRATEGLEIEKARPKSEKDDEDDEDKDDER